jgi:hypothetical protein
MDYAQARAILDKYGEDRCMQIIFDNGRVWLVGNIAKPHPDPMKRRRGEKLRDANGNIVYYKFSELVEFDEATDSIKMREFQHGVDQEVRDVIQWDIVNPIEGIQGFAFIPEEFDDKQAALIRKYWDPTLT